MSQTSFALPARQVTFGAGRSQYQQQQAQQAQQQAQAAQQAQQQQQQASQYYRQSGPGGGLALPGPGPATQAAQKAATAQPSSFATPAGPSTPAATAVPATPAPLTLEQQHITAVEGIVPTLQNIVATVNLDCRLDLKTIALHARNAEYNPKVG